MIDEIFKFLTPPDESLFFTRGDKNDPRMGDLVFRDVKNFEGTKVAIIGVPQDEGVKRNQGRPGASNGILFKLDWFFKTNEPT